jgi:hypothetical protein
MRGGPLSLVLVVTLALAGSTAVGALSCAAWLAAAQQVRLAFAVLSFATLVVCGELVAGGLLGWRLQRGQPWHKVALGLALWLTGSAGVVGGSVLAGPAPGDMIWLALAAAVGGGLFSAWTQRAPRALLRTTLPWAVGAGPLWWAAGCASPTTPSEAAVQGTAVVASILLPVVVARLV